MISSLAEGCLLGTYSDGREPSPRRADGVWKSRCRVKFRVAATVFKISGAKHIPTHVIQRSWSTVNKKLFKVLVALVRRAQSEQNLAILWPSVANG